MTPERLAYLIDRYKEGIVTPEEQEELDTWYHLYDDTASDFEAAHLSDPEVAAELKTSLQNSIQAGIDATKDNPVREFRASRRHWWQAAAAAFIGLLVIAGLFRRDIFKSEDSGTVTVSTNSSQNSRITLSDGSVIWVKPGSSVRYSKDFDKGAMREVFLEGEAFFDIARDEKRPFEVHTRELNIQVLGTSFNVRSYAEDPSVETTLIKGSVSIEKAHGTDTSGPVILAPNQRAVYSKTDKTVAVSEQENVVTANRKEPDVQREKLIFDEKPFTEVLSLMEQKFDIKIFIDDRHLQTCPFTADLEKENLVEILEILKLAYGIDYTVYRNELFIRGVVCNQ